MPSVTSTDTVWALYSFIVLVATPSVNVIVVAVPKFTSAAFLSLQVGLVPLGAADGPLKVKDLSPV